MITINASTITNNLLSNNKFSYKITKQGYAFNTDAEEYSYNAESLKEKLRHLKYSDKSDGADSSIIANVREFVSEYNSLKSNISEIDSTDRLTKYIKKFTLKAATSTKLEALFSKESDFMNKAENYSKKIYDETRLCMQKTFIEGDYSGTAPTESSVRTLATTLPSIVSCADVLSKGSYNSSNIDNLKELINNFIKYYNKYADDYQSAADKLSTDANAIAQTLTDTSKKYETLLNSAGINVDSSTGRLSAANPDGTSSLSDDIVSLEAVFGSSADYINTVKQTSESLFKTIIGGDSSDISIDFYA